MIPLRFPNLHAPASSDFCLLPSYFLPWWVNTPYVRLPQIAIFMAMNLVVLIIVLLLLFGGGGFYFGGPAFGGGAIGLILLICLIVFLFGGFRSRK